MSELSAIRRKSVADDVFEQFLQKIVTGEWPQNSMVPSENVLREALGVSRDSVREALKRLSALGLLESQQGKGSFVRKIDSGFYLNLIAPSLFLSGSDSGKILSFMKAIQVECARIACTQATDEDVKELSHLMDQMMQADNYDDFFSFDNGYHLCLARITGNELFIQSMDIASKLLRVYLKELVVVHGSEKSTQQHRQCLDAIMEHDAHTAAKVMVTHYDMLAERLKEQTERQSNRQ